MNLRDRNNFISSRHVTQWRIPLYLSSANILISQDSLWAKSYQGSIPSTGLQPGLSPGKEEVPRQKRPFRVKLEDSDLSIWSLWSWAERGEKIKSQLTWFSFLMDPSTWSCSFFLRPARHGTINYFLSLCIELRLQSLGNHTESHSVAGF